MISRPVTQSLALLVSRRRQQSACSGMHLLISRADYSWYRQRQSDSWCISLFGACRMDKHLIGPSSAVYACELDSQKERSLAGRGPLRRWTTATSTQRKGMNQGAPSQDSNIRQGHDLPTSRDKWLHWLGSGH